MYSSLRAGVPILAWPQDFDQFDNTARLLHHQLAVRLRPEPELIESDIRQLLRDPMLQANVRRMQSTISSYDTTELLLEMLNKHFPCDPFMR